MVYDVLKFGLFVSRDPLKYIYPLLSYILWGFNVGVSIDGIELDFITNNGMLLEAKYHSKLNAKQQKLFDSYDAKEKHVLNGFEGFMLLDTLEVPL